MDVLAGLCLTWLETLKTGFSSHRSYITSYIISSPEQLGSQSELIVYPSSWRPSVHPPFSKIFSSETAWPIKAKFYVEPPWEGGTNFYINGPGHMTKMAAMPIYGKNLKNLLLQNQKSYDLETWHIASGTQALVYINGDPGLTLTYFTARSNLVTWAFL